ncbi:DUF4236 domain-containing protein [Paenibacillus sp. TRM 82003]|uniref:DUF4236 domain-containing protein n=1 Tax=Kineococcus sp. TRM81007 TaxID=2925831 RepID=UPI001F59DC7B|nr:DUF4236 domain-containing protein [Kineococcus sp. TRM81007]MCI2240146.1 DUF4236 domain-containing protein [Kineococcus sp. TRM81007]MCI3925547.1 DUF4236 domain-containing protein [Paenibacillus sp. TRM 82003]
MGLIFRRSRNLGRGFRVNASNRGVSVSKRIGRATVDSRGRFAVRLFKGLTWHGRLWR